MMGKTNAERQAEYRLRQKGLGEKRRLNIWLSPGAHKRLGILTKQQGMSQQVLIEWLLTHENKVQEKLELSNEEQSDIPAAKEAALLRNDLSGRNKKLRPKKSKRLTADDEVSVPDDEGSPSHRSQQNLEFPSQFELKL